MEVTSGSRGGHGTALHTSTLLLLPQRALGVRPVQTRGKAGGLMRSSGARGCFRAETPSLLMVVLLLKVPGLCSTVWDSGSVDLWRTPVTSK